MKTKLIPIGNSRGIRIPKALIQQAGLGENVELVLRNGELVIRPTRKVNKSDPRAGWDEAMAKAVKDHGNELTQEDRDWMAFPNGFDQKEWNW
jgi:antitoxin MazE